jgi:hypothetical protein
MRWRYLMVVLVVMVGACSGSPTDTMGQNQTAEVSEADLSVGLGDLTEGLGLTDAQVGAVREVMEKYRNRAGEPGTLWYVAADLQEVFTADQITAIEARVGDRRAEMNSRRDEMPSRGYRGQGTRGQAFGGPGERAGLADLDLSEEQRARLQEIRESYGPQMEEIRDALRDGSLTRADAGVRLEAIRDAMHQAVQGVLTPDQQALLEKHRAEAEARRGDAEVRREDAKAQREVRRQAERSAMVAALGLTPEQVTAIEALEGWPAGEGRPSRDEMRARRDEHHQALLGILDDDQEQIWVLQRSLSVSLSRGPAHVGSGAGHRGKGRHGGQAAGGDGFRGPASRT